MVKLFIFWSGNIFLILASFYQGFLAGKYEGARSSLEDAGEYLLRFKLVDASNRLANIPPIAVFRNANQSNQVEIGPEGDRYSENTELGTSTLAQDQFPPDMEIKTISRRGWYFKIGTTTVEKEGIEICNKLKSADVDVRLEPVTIKNKSFFRFFSGVTKDKTIYEILVGPYSSKDEALKEFPNLRRKPFFGGKIFLKELK